MAAAPGRRWRPRGAAAGLAAVLALLFGIVASAAGAEPPAVTVRSFTYWLQQPSPDAVHTSGFDLAVVDYSRDGSGARAFKPLDVLKMRRRPDGGRRIVLSYLSIGEAETYRYYWKPEWVGEPPAWLDRENPDWTGNIKVRFWDPDWQRIIFGRPDAYLDRIIDAGFDGAYLDIVDAYWYWHEQGRATAEDEMVAFVRALSAYAKARREGFLIFPQNAEALLARDDYLAAIDGVGKESLLFGLDGPGLPNAADEIAWSQGMLSRARAAGRTVVAIEYVDAPDQVATAYRRLRELGFVPYASVRALDRMTINPGLDPPPARGRIGIR